MISFNTIGPYRMKNKQKFEMIIIIVTATFKRAEFLMFKEWWMDERLPVLKQKENAYIFTPMIYTNDDDNNYHDQL